MELIDMLTRKHTAFDSLADLIDLPAADYVPTLIAHQPRHARELEMLADAYDAEMVRRRDPRRAWRGTVHMHATVRRLIE
jgi:hypothetical protein